LNAAATGKLIEQNPHHLAMVELRTHSQTSRYTSPWSRGYRLRLLLLEVAWPVLCRLTPKPGNPWRLFILRRFGATIHGQPFVHQRARIEHPWNLTLHHKACLGDRAHAYCLGEVVIGCAACVGQEAYLCTGTHDFNLPHRPLQTAPICIGPNAFIGARAFVMPGVNVAEGAIVDACSVVTRSVPAATVVAGNPARQLAQVPLSLQHSSDL
jgi:putative colanic acid biosynthesis acetyltransferase WcaF